MNIERFIDEAISERSSVSRTLDHHPSEEELIRFAAHHLRDKAAWTVGAHVAACALCQEKAEIISGQIAEMNQKLAQFLPEPISRSKPELKPSRISETIRGLALLLWETPPLRRHAIAFVTASILLIFGNVWVHEQYAPKPSPFGSPLTPPWWSEIWVPYVVMGWAVVLIIYLVWRSRK